MGFLFFLTSWASYESKNFHFILTSALYAFLAYQYVLNSKRNENNAV